MKARSTAMTDPKTNPSPGLKPEIWVPGLILVAFAILFVFVGR
jgi:hypothetical protein